VEEGVVPEVEERQEVQAEELELVGQVRVVEFPMWIGERMLLSQGHGTRMLVSDDALFVDSFMAGR
jgi:hypothetical protein